MNSLIFKLLAVVFTSATLAACGGGGASPSASGPDALPAPELPQVPFASPAMIVPNGDVSTTIALTNCTDGLQTASLVVNSSGDMILTGAPSGTTTVSELQRINYATATYQYVAAENGANGPRTYIELQDGNDQIKASTYQSGSFSAEKDSVHDYDCSLAGGTTSFVLSSLPSSQRYASVFTSGVTAIDNMLVSNGTLTGAVLTWDNLQTNVQSLPVNDQPIRYISLDVNSGAVATSASPTGTFATTIITLPTTPTSTAASFEEEINGGTKTLFLEFARGIGFHNFKMKLEREGNLLRPTPLLNSNF